MKEREKIVVFGGGSWGTALAVLLARKGFQVRLAVRSKGQRESMQKKKENRKYLPGIRLPMRLTVVPIEKKSFEDAMAVIFAIPSHALRDALQETYSFLPEIPFLFAIKGIEEENLAFIDEVVQDVFQEKERMAFLAGPSFALEVAKEQPTAVVVSSHTPQTAQFFQDLLSTPTFRVYTTEDVRGTLVGGAVKNVIAIAVGISDGMELGHNARAALITRGLSEIMRFGKKLGANPLTLAGLSGLGDLVLTCTGDLSRNRRLGMAIAQGKTLDEALKEIQMVAEGVKTAKALHFLAKEHKVDMPISEQVYAILYENKSPKEALDELMSRPLKAEYI